MRHELSILLLICLCALTPSGPVHAEPAQPSDAPVEPPTASTRLHPAWSPVLLPVSMIAPGTGHLIRGEKEAGGTLLLTGGVLLGTGLLAATGLGASGAADVPSGILIPVVVVSMSSFLALGSADFVGTFSAGAPSPSPDVFTDAWAAQARLGGRYLWAQDEALDQAHLFHAFGDVRSGRWRFGGEVGTDAAARVLFAGATASRLIVPLQDAPAAGLWLRAGILNETNGRADYVLLGGNLDAELLLPLGLLWPTLSRVTGEVRLGVRPWIAKYGGGSWEWSNLELTGGSGLRWAATSWLRPYWGYEHGRDRFVGGQGIGFFGSFFGGAEFRLARGVWLDVRGNLGTPNAVQASVEHRW